MSPPEAMILSREKKMIRHPLRLALAGAAGTALVLGCAASAAIQRSASS